MAVVNLTATTRGSNAVMGKGDAGNVKAMVRTVEVGSSDSANSTYSFGRVPAGARILAKSTLYTDDLASTGSPTLDIGLFAVNDNVTSDDDALNDGIDVATVTETSVVKDFASAGLPAWDHVSGQTSNPGGELEIKATLKDAAVNVGGTMTMEVFYIVD